jgi:hypothetical protein
MKIMKYLTVFVLMETAFAAKTLIITVAYNRPDFIEWQYKTFKKFIIDPYEYVVFNDAENIAMAKDIENVCKKFGVRHVRVPQTVHKNLQEGYKYWETAFSFPDKNYRVDFRAGEAAQYALETAGFSHDGIFAMMDSDIFVIQRVNISELVGDCAAWHRAPILMFFNVLLLPSFSTINLNAGFVGSRFWGYGWFLTTFYFNAHNQLKIKLGMEHYIYDLALKSERQLAMEGFSDSTIRFCKTYAKFLGNNQIDKTLDQINIIDNIFLHYCHGSNWVNSTDKVVKLKSKAIAEYIAAITA